MVGRDQFLVLTNRNSRLCNHYYILMHCLTTCFIPKLHSHTQYEKNISNHVARFWWHCVLSSAVTMCCHVNSSEQRDWEKQFRLTVNQWWQQVKCNNSLWQSMTMRESITTSEGQTKMSKMLHDLTNCFYHHSRYQQLADHAQLKPIGHDTFSMVLCTIYVHKQKAHKLQVVWGSLRFMPNISISSNIPLLVNYRGIMQ